MPFSNASVEPDLQPVIELASHGVSCASPQEGSYQRLPPLQRKGRDAS